MICSSPITDGYIVDSGGDYLLVVKDNQKELKEAVEGDFIRSFSPAGQRESDRFLSEAQTHDKEHGRVVFRQLRASTRIVPFLTEG